MKTAADFRQSQSRAMLALRNLIRRCTVGVTTPEGLWQALGFDDEKVDEVEAFTGLGVAARPKEGSDVEVIIANVGAEGGHPIIIAVLDGDVVELEPDERAYFNSLAMVHVTKTGKVEVKDRVGGAAVPLATKADLDQLRTWINTHKHSCAGGTLGLTGTFDVSSGALPSPAGTSVLKGQ